jgi:hypothetical protein
VRYIPKAGWLLARVAIRRSARASFQRALARKKDAIALGPWYVVALLRPPSDGADGFAEVLGEGFSGEALS